jgi:hypothetical protein
MLTDISSTSLEIVSVPIKSAALGVIALSLKVMRGLGGNGQVYADGDLLTINFNKMTELEMAKMLADYHKECDAADGLGDKGRIQLKHARKIMQALRIHDVVGQSEQLVCEYCNEDDKPTCCDSCLEGMVNAVQKAN